MGSSQERLSRGEWSLEKSEGEKGDMSKTGGRILQGKGTRDELSQRCDISRFIHRIISPEQPE